MSVPTDPSHPLVQRLLNEAVASRGGWTAGAPTNTFEALAAFVHAVHWAQPFFYLLLAVHAALLIVALLVRHRPMAQLLLLGALLAMVSLSEWLNGLCKARWRVLTTEDYFDDGGIFAALTWSAPLALIAFITLVSTAHALPAPHPPARVQRLLTPLFCAACDAQIFLLYDTSTLLIVVKRKQLQLQRRRKAPADAKATGAPPIAADRPTAPSSAAASTDGAHRRRPVDEAHHAKFVLD